jgi:hypothetical protein
MLSASNDSSLRNSKSGIVNTRSLLDYMAHPTGFEPVTSAFGGQYTTHSCTVHCLPDVSFLSIGEAISVIQEFLGNA